MATSTLTKSTIIPFSIWTYARIPLLLLGWISSWAINNWHLTVPVLVLWLGWFGVLATMRSLWRASMAVAADADDDQFALSRSRKRELLGEKKSLLQAIKEIEFDRDLGKMSPEDADEIMRFYRARAIDVIKDLDGLSETELTAAERMERDLKARLAVEKAKTKKKNPTSKKATS